MSHQDIDKEIAHLQLVFALISPRDRFPLSYWHRRLHALTRSTMMPSQRARVVKLEAMLRSAAARIDQVTGITRLHASTARGGSTYEPTGQRG
ncbi:hypothetical protein [Paraburkholderia sp. ZP32-5]|uniref:hypothetical protein n=1 Tax=Paraburkholderia sp. ZP32-5 TaxID=2883245 RepID=UPI001F2AF39C|nr:hypothetical protein [Paraburkholderia sp. ZP32-5]